MPAERSNPKPTPDVMEAYLELSKDGVAIVNLEGIVEYCNTATLHLLGYGPEDLAGKHFEELPFLLPEHFDKTRALFRELMDNGEIEQVEMEVKRKDGRKIWIETHGTLLRKAGKPFALMSVSRDIGEKKRMEDDIRQYHNFEQLVLEISGRFIGMPDDQLDQGMQDVLEEVSSIIGARRAGFFLISEDQRLMVRAQQWAADNTYEDQGLEIEIPVHTFSQAPVVLSRREDYVICRPSDLPESAKGEHAWYEREGFHPIYIVPIISEGKLVGTLGFIGEHGKEHLWPTRFSRLLRFAGSVLYAAEKRKEIYRNLRLARFTLERYSDGVLWIRDDFSLYDVNTGACTLLGYSREELIDLKIGDFHAGIAEEDIRRIWSEIKSEGHKRLEAELIRKDRTVFPADIYACHIEFEGQVSVVAFVHDITGRKVTEDAIRRSENEFRKIFENVVDVFYEASLDGNLVNVTPSVERLTRYKREELIGEPMVGFYADPELREPVLKEIFEKGFVREFEIGLKDKDGSSIPISLSARLICNAEGNPTSIVGSISDLTERKKAEIQIRQLSTALEQSPTPILITDKEARVLFVNNSFLSFLKMDPEELLGKLPGEITRGQIQLSGNVALWKTITSGKVFRDEIRYTMADGTKYWLSVIVSPVMDEHNEPSHYVAIFEDISGRKAYERSLEKARDRAEESDRLKSAFLANMSHEIRTPMNAILGFSSLLKEQQTSKEQRDYYIDIINSKGKDLLRIISDIIDISRIETGDLYIKTEPVEVFSFMRKVFDEFREDTQLKTRGNLQFRLSMPESEIPVIINTDAARLKQVFVNLIQNAIKFTPEGYIETGFELEKDNNIRMFVRDTGIGIPAGKQELIFDRFRQIDDSHTRQYGGTGLGLAICMNLVEKMGGELQVKSAEGQGSEFYFNLKYILTRAPETEEERPEKAILDAGLDLEGKRILIVEDDGASYLFLDTLLSRYKPEVIWAKNGIQAIANVEKRGKFDMILMDIRMPEMDGMKATREIRSIDPDIPIIAQTAYAQVSDRKAAIESGCNDYLSKPISPLELKTILLKYFGES